MKTTMQVLMFGGGAGCKPAIQQTGSLRYVCKAVLLVCGSLFLAAQPLTTRANEATAESGSAIAIAEAGDGDAKGGSVLIQRIEPAEEGDKPVIDPVTGMPVMPPLSVGAEHNKQIPWLGAAVEEAPEALGAQLGLNPGAGLVVLYVYKDSPAAKAGLQKNDLLVQLDGQELVHPAQFRKLVRMRKEGDAVKLLFYHAGKKQTASATLSKPPKTGFLDDEQRAWELRSLSEKLGGIAGDAGVQIKIDSEKIREEIQKSLEEARKAYEQALRQGTDAASQLEPLRKELEKLGKETRKENTSVIVRSAGKSTKSIVKADESGIFVIVCNPKPQLTAHDKDGKLLFDGEIDTPEQRAKVPPDLWKKVEPLLGKLQPHVDGPIE